MTSRNEVDRVKVDHLTLGQTVTRDLELPALRAADVGGDGLIGIDALQQQRLMDFETRVVRIEDARLPPPKRVYGEIVITAKRRRGQLIPAHVRAGGFPLDAVIDTRLADHDWQHGSARKAVSRTHRKGSTRRLSSVSRAFQRNWES